MDHELPITEEYAAREVTLPLFPTITKEQIDYVSEHVKKGLEIIKGQTTRLKRKKSERKLTKKSIL